MAPLAARYRARARARGWVTVVGAILDGVTAEPASIEPVMAEPPSRPRRILTRQWWRDVTLLHWTADPAVVGALMPPGVRPDLLDGQTYVGLVAFLMDEVGPLSAPGVPYLGRFPETNVRLYSVDRRGRRGVVFRSMDAARLLPVLIGRAALRLPYVWSRMTIDRDGDRLTYSCRRRRGTRLRSTTPPSRAPGSRSWSPTQGPGTENSTTQLPAAPGLAAQSLITVRPTEVIAEPSPLEHFLTARWALHTAWRGRTLYLPNAHPRWPLRRAELLDLDDSLVFAAGLPAPSGPPVSVLYSTGVPVRFGWPTIV